MSEEMHPSAGSGRDPESQKNILRKLINTMKEGTMPMPTQYRKASIAQFGRYQQSSVVDSISG